jgi:hypothetical protein
MLGVEKPEVDVQTSFDLQVMTKVEVAGMDVLNFGVLA